MFETTIGLFFIIMSIPTYCIYKITDSNKYSFV